LWRLEFEAEHHLFQYHPKGRKIDSCFLEELDPLFKAKSYKWLSTESKAFFTDGDFALGSKASWPHGIHLSLTS